MLPGNWREYRIVLRRRKWLALACIGCCLVLSIGINLFMPPVYRSSTTIEIAREPSRSPLTGAPTDAAPSRSDIQPTSTMASIVTSRTLLTQVVTQLQQQGVFAVGRGQDVETAIDRLRPTIVAEPIRDTQLLRISVEHTNARVAATIANTIAKECVNYAESQRSQAESMLAEYLRTQADELNTKIETLERLLQGSSQTSLFSVEGKIRQLSDQVRDLNTSYTTTRADLFSISSQLSQAKSASESAEYDSIPISINTDALTSLRRDLFASNAALAKARGTYGALHPKLMALQSENDAIRRSIRQETASAIIRLAEQRSILDERATALQREIAKEQEMLRQLNDQAEKLRAIDRDATSARDLQNLLTARAREVDVTSRIKSRPVRIVDPAQVMASPIRPRKMLNLVIGLVLGVLSASGLVFLLEALRRTIRTPGDVEQYLELPVLGVIPKEAQQ